MTNSRASKIIEKIYGYPEQVLSGEILACDKVRRACERFRRELDRSLHDSDYPWKFVPELGARPCLFMEQFLTPTKGDYDRMELLPWECFVEGNIYGWVDKKTGLRRFREGLIVVGRGNGKSTLMAGNAAFGASKDGERGAEIYLLANSKEQASIVYEECRKQIMGSAYLSPHFRPLRDGIHFDQTNSIIQHRSSDSHRLDGLNPHMGIFDEIHEYKDSKLINVIKRGMNKRAQPLSIYITTMGTVLDGVLTNYYALFSDAMDEGVLAQGVADRMFTYICELDKDDDIEDSRNWIKANPSLGHLLKLETLQGDWARSRSIPQEKADFITKQLNITVDGEDAEYLTSELINRNNDVIPLDSLIGRSCYGGYDLSSRDDFTAAALLFPLDDGRWFILHHSWVPRRKVELDQEKIDFYNFAMLGILTICEGEYITQDTVFAWFKEMAKKYSILSIGYDPANAVWLNRMLVNEGFSCEIVRQGPLTLNDPMKDFQEKMKDGLIVTNKDPMLRWYMHNVRLRNHYADLEKENWMPTKRNRYRKIDGFMATIDAWTVATHLEPTANESADVDISIFDL